MPAEFEKVVVAPDLLHVQQLGPELRQQGFHPGVRGFIHARDKGILGRRRQRLAVEFAVGGQGQRVQLRVGGGQHVIGQRGLQVGAQGFDLHRFAGDEPGEQLPIA